LALKVAESPTTGSVEAAQGREMNHEWALLIQSMTPPLPTLKEQQLKEEELERLKRRMVSFLAAAFASVDSNGTHSG
jgi:hypothetical protein